MRPRLDILNAAALVLLGPRQDVAGPASAASAALTVAGLPTGSSLLAPLPVSTNGPSSTSGLVPLPTASVAGGSGVSGDPLLSANVLVDIQYLIEWNEVPGISIGITFTNTSGATQEEIINMGQADEKGNPMTADASKRVVYVC